jgi:hypothetical protein
MRASLILGLSLSLPALAQTHAVDDQRQDIIKGILTTDRPALVERKRQVCLNGQEPARVKEARSSGMDFTPDAVDSCVAALQRSARDNQLAVIYQKLVNGLGGDSSAYQTLPKAIGAAVLSGDGKVPIGNGLAAPVSPELAFDAGFVVAYTDRAAKKEADPLKLRALAETCLNARGDPGTCFSAGYVYGSQWVNAR